MRHAIQKKKAPTIGSLFAGIGGFDLGFERAGYRTVWQVEINPVCRAVLAERFPGARRFDDVKTCGRANLAPVDVITAGFPCQDISTMGSKREGGRQGLDGERSGLFWEVCRILDELRPPWVVLENVAGLFTSNDSRDFQTVVKAVADRGYLGFWRLLDAQYFGVPQARRRVFLVAGFRRHPPIELLADASPMAPVSLQAAPRSIPCEADAHAAYTLRSPRAASQIGLGCENFVAHEGGWGAMVERQRMSERDGLCLGLDEASSAEARAAGNAVVPQVAEWIARHLRPA